MNDFEEFDRELQRARGELAVIAAELAGDRAVESIRLQLEALHEWTRGGRCPSQGEKDSLNFGLLASRELDTYDIASTLYELASFVTWWGHKRPY
jgi:hypothetical protein